ncbi:MAG: arginine N-succinyltransferase [Verrucomicrobia bacterium]|nr:MAG: arginine N-succinyltransferase [Verrucomicrobiota bacterium]
MGASRIRPVRPEDLDGFEGLATRIRGGLTSLPPDRDLLEHKIEQSVRAFEKRVLKPGGEYYLFVLEDLESSEIMGTSGVLARVGGFDPFYSYEIRRETFSHEPLGLDREVDVLHLKTNHKGPSEVCSLYLRPESRGSGRGRLLSLCRFLFMGMYPDRFDVEVLSEMRGYIDPEGRSPFWESVGRHFFQKDFTTADFLSGLGNKAFIEDLMPEYPIYVNLLPPEVQDVIGRVHPDTEPALRMLRDEGFAFAREVDIFDAGPLVRTELNQVRTIRASRQVRVESIDELKDRAADHMIGWGGLDFRCCLGVVETEADGSVRVLVERPSIMELPVGDPVMISPLRSGGSL